MPAHLQLIQDGRTTADVAAQLCDELCAAADEAVSLEEALRAVLRILATRMGWTAGRAVHRDAFPAWHVASFDSIGWLRRALGNDAFATRNVDWGEPWSVAQKAGLATTIFPLEWSAESYLELYAVDAYARRDATLDDLARALVPVGALLRRKRGERSQRPSRDAELKLFLGSPLPCFLVREGDRKILLANDAAAAALGYRRDELAALRFDDLLMPSEPNSLPRPGTSVRMRQRRRDGQELTVEVRAHPQEAPDGAPALIVVATDVTHLVVAEQRLETAASTDALTGLQNRAAFERHLALAVERSREGALFALLFIDLDRFKAVNDTHGHAAGDVLLCEIGRRLRAELRSGDLAARLGGDEFTVLLPLRELAEAVTVAERVQGALLRPFEIGPASILPSASIGVAFAGAHAPTSAALLADADAAMYRAKAKGPGNVVFSAAGRTAP